MDERSARIHGVVYRQGLPACDVTVAIARGSGPCPDIAAVTGPDGRYALPCAGPGEFTVVASGDAARITRQARVGAGESVELDFELDAD